MTRTRLTKQARREQLLDVLAAVVSREGIAAATVERVAERAGVSKALPYAHFDNASEMLSALYDREAAIFDRRIVEAVRSGTDLESRIRAAADAALDLLAERWSYQGILFIRAGQGAITKRQKRREAASEAFFASIFERELGLDHAVAVDAAVMVLSAFDGLVRRWVAREPRERLVETFVRLATGGLRELA